MFNITINGRTAAIAYSETDARIIAAQYKKTLERLSLIGRRATVNIERATA